MGQYVDKTLVSGMLPTTDFVKVLQKNGYVIMLAHDSEHKIRKHPKKSYIGTHQKPTHTLIILVDPDSSVMSGAQYFAKMLSRIPSIKSDNVPHNYDIIIVPCEAPGSNITNKLSEFVSDGNANKGYVRIVIYDYRTYFTSVRVRHINAPKARILTEEEIVELTNSLYMDRTALRKIRSNEVVCVWLGAEPGEVLLEECRSEVTGAETIASYVV
jgi:DNA-directed RNA polymerase subunit H (RpoH/RPB5)